MRRVLGVALGGLLLLGACGGDDDGSSGSSSGGDRDAYIEAMAEELINGEDRFEGLTDTDATCFATVVVDVAGADNLAAADITPEDITDAEYLASLDIEMPESAAVEIAAGIEDCGVAELMGEAMVSWYTATMDAVLSEESATCLTDNIDAAEVALFAAERLVGQQDSDSGFSALLEAPMRVCPTFVTEIVAVAFAAELGADLSPDGLDCLAGYVETNIDAVAPELIAGGTPSFDGLVAACPELAPS